jgi:apolipoprotein N-acyltransferase
MEPVKKNRVGTLFLILSGALLLILSFPKVSFSFLAWISFLPFFKLLENQRAGKRFRLGYIFGMVYSLGVFYWVTHSMRYYGGLDPVTSFAILVLMVFYLALFTGAFAWLWGLRPSKGLFSLLWAPSLWVGLEFLRAHLLTGFPWELLGHSQYNFLPVAQMAEWTGVYGISFLIILVNQTLYQCFLANRLDGFRRWKEAAPTLVLMGVILAFGYQALSEQKAKDLKAQSIKVSVVQGNIDQSLKWNPAFQEKTIDIYKNLTLNSQDGSSDLIIWPETAVPFYFLGENRFTSDIFRLAKDTGASLLFGSPAFGFVNGQMQYYNRSYLLSPEGRLSYYDKVHLVPFGEYVPLKRFLPFVGKMVQAIGDFSPGPSPLGLSLPKAKLGVLICFETIFPELSRSYKQEGCHFLVNITNDAWFGKTSAPYQHLSMLIFRAIENRVWIARAANTGFSAFIDSSGRITQSLPLFQSGRIYATIPLREDKTFYARYGDLLVVFSGMILALGLFLRLIRK